MWFIREHKQLGKVIRRLPDQMIKTYELWKNLVHLYGPNKLKEFPDFHDEKLTGIRTGQRSSRLNIQYRVIYTVEHSAITIYVIEVTPHKY